MAELAEETAPLSGNPMVDVATNIADTAREAALTGMGFHKVSDELYTAGQVSEQLMREIASAGIRSVVNLRFSTEDGFEDLTELADELNMQYRTLPFNGKSLSHQVMDRVTAELDVLPKPALVHCATGKRATVAALSHAATREAAAGTGISGKISAPDVDLESRRPSDFQAIAIGTLQSFVSNYVRDKLVTASQLPCVTKIRDDMFIAPQLTEPQLQAARDEHGIKSVLNLRSPDEAGNLGLGVLAREKEVVLRLGMEYAAVPTKAGADPTVEEVDAVERAYQDLEKPILIHCRTMRRSTVVAQEVVARTPRDED